MRIDAHATILPAGAFHNNSFSAIAVPLLQLMQQLNASGMDLSNMQMPQPAAGNDNDEPDSDDDGRIQQQPTLCVCVCVGMRVRVCAYFESGALLC